MPRKNKKNLKVRINPSPLEQAETGSPLNLYDEDNPDINLFNIVDDELIRLSGSEMLVYLYYKSESVDDVYMEERDKVIHFEPVVVNGHYDPKLLEENLSEFGITVENDQLFTFNKSYIVKRLGREIMAGDIIQPKFQNIRFKIFEVQEDHFDIYGVYHLVASAKTLRDRTC